ncbi:hypothetical protein IW137_001235 [Coemansia sp. RSA 1287]|nr:hypothetical protein IW137_001235 [Coemansia sp. RSA 1287]
MYVAYGQTEALSIISGAFWPHASGDMGVLYPNCSAKIIDSNGAETSEYGELCVRGPQVMKGYVGRGRGPLTSDGFLRSGDCAQATNGHIHIRGRIADIIHTQNGPVYPVDIENKLAEHPDVQDAAVVGIGLENNESPVAFLVLKPNVATKPDAIEQWLTECMGISVACRAIKDIPKSPAGKILRHLLVDGVNTLELSNVEFQDHYDLVQRLGIRGGGALLELALMQYAMTRATAGFVPHITPDAAQSSVVDACGFRLRSNVEDVCGESGEASQIYRMTPVADERGEHNADPLYLVATAEIPWVIIKQQQTLDGFSPPESPSRLSHCFRTKAGARGRDTRGIYRLHQFAKVKLVTLSHPTHSDTEL